MVRRYVLVLKIDVSFVTTRQEVESPITIKKSVFHVCRVQMMDGVVGYSYICLQGLHAQRFSN